MRRFSLGALLVWLLASGAMAFEFVPPEAPQGGTGQVINGAQVTDPSRWPATFIFRSDTGSCTATAVGERVVLTAAHCIGHEEAGSVLADGALINLQCFHHPGYPANSTTDFALCLTETAMTNIPFEVVSSAIAYPRIGHEAVLVGFGCTESGGHDRAFGTLFEGKTTVIRRPNGPDIDTVTRGGAAVCFGDSGGASYFNLTPSGNRRALFAVNSRGDINSFSFLSTLATPQFVDWAIEWSTERSVAICGLDVAAVGCR